MHYEVFIGSLGELYPIKNGFEKGLRRRKRQSRRTSDYAGNLPILSSTGGPTAA